MNQVAVKICGITHEEDALAAIDAGADFLGFNTWPGTKRFIDLGKHAKWIAPLQIQKVALLVNATLEEARSIASLPWIDALQLHGDEDEQFCRTASTFGKPLIKALRPKSAEALAGSDQFSTQHVLVDAHVPGAYGGTGSAVNLELACEFSRQFPSLTLWLAGGLKAENVGSAVEAVRPAVVDVSSGVELDPGKKDPGKMRAFITAAKEA